MTCWCMARKKGRFSTKLKSSLLIPVLKLKAPRNADSYAKIARSMCSTAVLNSEKRREQQRIGWTSGSYLHDADKQLQAAKGRPHAKVTLAKRPTMLLVLWTKGVRQKYSAKVRCILPDITARMKALVTPLYRLEYSTVNHFPEPAGPLPDLLCASTSVSARRESPSRCLVKDHVCEGRVNCERSTAGGILRCRLRDEEGDDSDDSAAVTAFDPKNLRSSDPASRWGSDTDNRFARVCVRVSRALSAFVCLRSGYLCI